MGRIKAYLGDLKRSSRFLSYLYYYSRVPKYKKLISQKEAQAKKRADGEIDLRFIGIKKFKNIHKGERCFIVATGPSLTLEDLKAIEGEYSFGMNSITKLFDKTTWRPTYYGIQDYRVYEKMESSILSEYKDANNVFVSDEIGKRFSIPSNFQQFPLNSVYNCNELEIDKYFSEFSDDSYVIVYDGYSITYSLIEIAVYMGFKSIYLLGVDCSYKRGEKNHIVESGNDDKNEEKNYEKMIIGYKKAKEYAIKHDIRIINCTRGGMLEVFERMPLKSALEERK